MSSVDVAVKIGTSHEISTEKENKKKRRHSSGNSKKKGDDDKNDKNKNGSVDSILSSPQNPNTVKRKEVQTQEGNNEVSWHKRVVVHRIPRQDASRSMWNDRDKQQADQSKCCILL